MSATIYVHPTAASNVAKLARLLLATGRIAIINTGQPVQLVHRSQWISSTTQEQSR